MLKNNDIAQNCEQRFKVVFDVLVPTLVKMDYELFLSAIDQCFNNNDLFCVKKGERVNY